MISSSFPFRPTATVRFLNRFPHVSPRAFFALARKALLGVIAGVPLIAAGAGPTEEAFTVATPDASTISLEGSWRFRRDDERPDGNASDFGGHYVRPETLSEEQRKDRTGYGLSFGFHREDYDDHGWERINAPATWSSQGIRDDQSPYHGPGWYRQRVVVPEAWKGDTLLLQLGQPQQRGTVYWNGEKVAHVADWGGVFTARLRPDRIHYGAPNTIAMEVSNWYRDGGLIRGPMQLTRIRPFGTEKNRAHPAPRLLSLTSGLKEGLLEKDRWEAGWRDGGTSDTRPKMGVARKAFRGEDAVSMNVWYPNSAEFVDFLLPEGERGRDWAGEHFEYISFWYKTEDLEGEMQIRLNEGRHRWMQNPRRSKARFTVRPGGWKQVVIPFGEFVMMPDANPRRGLVNRITDLSFVTAIALGYENNRFRGKGTILLSHFEVGAFPRGPLVAPLPLEGIWKFRKDDTRPDGTPGDLSRQNAPATEQSKEQRKDRDGYGVQLGYHTEAYDDGGWDLIEAPGDWGAQGFRREGGQPFHGVGWYRQQILVPGEWGGEPLLLELGMPNQRGRAYWNGEPVSEQVEWGAPLAIRLPPDQVRFGELNTVAVRVENRYRDGGISRGRMRLAPANAAALLVSERDRPEQALPPSSFEMGLNPDRPLDLLVRLARSGEAAGKYSMEYEVCDPFQRVITGGTRDLSAQEPGVLKMTVPLSVAESRQLYEGEWFSMRGVVRGPDGALVAAFAWPTDENAFHKLAYRERDRLSLPPLEEEVHEETPYGRLRLVDVIDCAVDPARTPHPYKEGGIRASWAGTRAYNSWERGIRVEEFKGRGYREANNNEFFGYRIGRGKMKPHTAYLLRVLYPDNKPRYFAMDVQAGRNYQGTGFRGGISAGHPKVPYPQSGQYQWYDHLVFNDIVTYGYEGARHVSSENGFWVFFFDIGRALAAEWDAGPAVAELRLYEVENIEAHYPEIRYPEGEPRRTLMMDWEREPEAPPYDVARYGRFLGLNAISPSIQKWGAGGFWQTRLGFEDKHHGPLFEQLRRVKPDVKPPSDIYKGWLEGTKKAGIALIPRVEYGGGPQLPEGARVIGSNGKISPAGRFVSWGANILDPRTWDEFAALIDEIVGRHHREYPQIAGLLWRQRSDRIAPSYGKADVEKFCAETGHPMPKGNAEAIAKWASRTMAKQYHAWWQGKRADFLRKTRDLLRSYDPGMVLYYYNWDEDGWNMGLGREGSNTKEDWSDLYNVHRARAYFKRREELRRWLKDEDYVRMLTAWDKPHRNLYPELFGKDEGIVLFAPLQWHYLADNAPYLNYFRTGAGLGTCTQFIYEEKYRCNVQNDNYETSEMTPGGHDFGMAEEVLAMFHGDPWFITWTPYTYGRGWVDVHRRFAQAFLALPAKPGREVNHGDKDVKIRRYDTAQGCYIGVTYRGFGEKTLRITIPGIPEGARVEDRVTGGSVPSRRTAAGIEFEIRSAPMGLHAFRIR